MACPLPCELRYCPQPKDATPTSFVWLHLMERFLLGWAEMLLGGEVGKGNKLLCEVLIVLLTT